MQDEAKAEFQARVERIRAGGAGTNRTLFVGSDTGIAIPKGFVAKNGLRRRKSASLIWLVVMLACGGVTAGVLASGLPVAELVQPLAERLTAV